MIVMQGPERKLMNSKDLNLKSSILNSQREGIALLMVLWVLTILMVIALSFSFVARTETHSTLSFKERVEEKFIAEAGIERGIMEAFYWNMFKNQMITTEGREVWRADGTPYTGHLGDGYYTVRIMDEAGKLDINTLTDASGIILKNLLMNSGVKEDVADTIVDSILDWKDADDLRRLHGAESDYYMSLPNPYKAKNANFDTLEELLLVKGMTPEILYGSAEKKGINDFITVTSGWNIINVNAAPREVLMAVPGMTPEIVDRVISYRTDRRITNPQQEVGIPAESMKFINIAESNKFTIDAVGYKGNSKRGYAIRAVVAIIGSNYQYVYYKSPSTITQ